MEQPKTVWIVFPYFGRKRILVIKNIPAFPPIYNHGFFPPKWDQIPDLVQPVKGFSNIGIVKTAAIRWGALQILYRAQARDQLFKDPSFFCVRKIMILVNVFSFDVLHNQWIIGENGWNVRKILPINFLIPCCLPNRQFPPLLVDALFANAPILNRDPIKGSALLSWDFLPFLQKAVLLCLV